MHIWTSQQSQDLVGGIGKIFPGATQGPPSHKALQPGGKLANQPWCTGEPGASPISFLTVFFLKDRSLGIPLGLGEAKRVGQRGGDMCGFPPAISPSSHPFRFFPSLMVLLSRSHKASSSGSEQHSPIELSAMMEMSISALSNTTVPWGYWAPVIWLVHLRIWIFIYFYFLAVPRGLQDLSSPTRDWARALGSESMES